jgi:hypothetical protein
MLLLNFSFRHVRFDRRNQLNAEKTFPSGRYGNENASARPTTAFRVLSPGQEAALVHFSRKKMNVADRLAAGEKPNRAADQEWNTGEYVEISDIKNRPCVNYIS